MRKPGEPIYLWIHLFALLLVIVATVVLPRAAEFFVVPLSFGTRALAGVGIAVVGGIALYLLYNSSARNEP
ncbi:MAG: hypothetical protein H8K05_01420 [Nitrospira sp.]|nr:hypothetical protein [Nitrospira sp.]